MVKTITDGNTVKFKKGQCKSLTFLKSVFWVFCPEKSLALPSPERIRCFCHINNKINSIFRRWQSKSRRASGAGPQDDKGILIISKWVEIHAHGDTPQPPVKNMVILHLENEFTLLNHLTCSVWWNTFQKINSVIIFWKTQLHCMCHLGRLKGWICQINTFKIHQTSSSHSLYLAIVSPISTDGTQIHPSSCWDQNTWKRPWLSPFSHTPLSECQEILQALPSVYPQSDYLPCLPLSPLSPLTHCLITIAARPASTFAPMPHHQSIFNTAASVNPLKYNRSIHLSAQKPHLPIMVE